MVAVLMFCGCIDNVAVLIMVAVFGFGGCIGIWWLHLDLVAVFGFCGRIWICGRIGNGGRI